MMQRIVLLLLAVAVGLLLLVAMQAAVPAREAQPRVALAGSIDFERLFEKIPGDQIRRIHQRIVQPPSRLAGTAGDLEASGYVEREFDKMGLEVLVQTYPVTAPVTHRSELTVLGPPPTDKFPGTFDAATAVTAASGERLGISIAPFWPNHVRTCTTGPDGIVGTVIDAGTGRLEDLDGKDIRGNIMLLRMTPDYDWLAAAKLGAAAILFRPAADPFAYSQKFLMFPADLPRFFVEGPVAKLIGKRVRIDARVDWKVVEARNVFGILRAPEACSEALIQIAFTDSWSVVPDRAPGYYEACSVTALLATARALVDQKKGLVRDTIFVACSGRSLGSIGPRRIVDALGLRDRFDENRALLDQRLADAERGDAALNAAVEAAGRDDYWRLGAEDEARLWDRYGREARGAFCEVVSRLIDQTIDTAARRAATARIAWEQAGRPQRVPLMDEHVEAARLLRRARSAAGADGLSLKEHFRDVLERSQCRERLHEALEDARDHASAELKYQRDTNRVADLLGSFDRSYYMILAPSTHGTRLRYECDEQIAGELDRARDTIVLKWLERAGRGSGHGAVDRHLLQADGSSEMWVHTGPNRAFPVEKKHRNIFIQITRVIRYSLHVPFLIAGTELPVGYQTPLDTSVSYEDLAGQTQLIAAVAAHILSTEQPMSRPDVAGRMPKRWFSDIGGEVVNSASSNLLMPSRRVPDSVVVLKGMLGRYFHIQKARNGMFRFPAVEVGPGRLLADAFTIDETSGRITGARDMGFEGKRFKTSYYKHAQFKEPQTRITLVLASMVPTDLYQLIGPANQPITLEPLDAALGGPMDRYSIAHDWENGATVFIEPGRRFHLIQRNYPHYRYYGREEDRQGSVTKGYLMGWGRGGGRGAGPAANDAPGELDTGQGKPLDVRGGDGYLAGAVHRVVFQEIDAAASMAQLNRNRLDKQVEHGLADPVDSALARQALRRLSSGLDATKRKQYTQAYRDLSESVAFSIRAYPSVRTALSDAVLGILLYMFLCVPFSLFAERLLIGARDIRMRLVSTFGLFLLVFLVIRIAHPAYDMVSAPLIVLVGFVIFMLCALTLAFVVGRFAERMADLRRAGVGAAHMPDRDISRAAAATIAFSLGINNMGKRKVRTALTAATVASLSFCLICFSAPRPRLLKRQIVVGPSQYDGVLMRFERAAAGHLGAARTRYGDRATIIGRRSVYQSGWQLHYVPPRGRARLTHVGASLFVQQDDGRLKDVDGFLRAGRWFDRHDDRVCYLSEVVAAELGIDPAHLNVVGEPSVEVLLAGWPIRVAGIFDSALLDTLRDIDGEAILPEFDGDFTGRARVQRRAEQVVGRPGGRHVATSHIPAARTVVMPLNPETNGLVSSIALVFDDQSYGAKRQVIDQMMDNSAVFISYALDGLSYFGGHFRFAGFETVVDLVVPLLVASLIVFSTMLGTVYERQREISVYAAVGLSPRHVFFLFLAESLVYAVMGVVGGYLLALGLQWLSHHVSGLGALTINFSSRSAIYVTLTVMGAVVTSAFVPAWRAARIASPAERLTWTVPTPQAPGRLDIVLPFTYVGREVLAVAAFLAEWFESRSEDASAEFTASQIKVDVQWPQSDDGRPTFTVMATTWLRPYDLGVSQRVTISIELQRSAMHSDIYAAAVHMEMLGGDEVSWQRTNRRFIGLLRRHLLSWRALPPSSKCQLLDLSVSKLGLDQSSARWSHT
ncbi:MAG: hypothetical protein CMJ18_25910 [Phycisphaeraceae bacterium]|nr:hypothetical protein [Phycisphaeraceae bacterium]